MSSPYLPPVKGSMRWIFRPDARSGIGYQVRTIAAGDQGTRQTIEPMIEMARQGSNHPGIREAAERAVRLSGAPAKNGPQELRAVHDYVKANTRYLLDNRGKERIQHPAYTLFVSGVGDCDDLNSLVTAMAGSIGYGAAFRTIKADPERPNEFSHVYSMLGYRDERGQPAWIAADVTQLNAQFGWEPPRERVFEVKDWLAIPP